MRQSQKRKVPDREQFKENVLVSNESYDKLGNHPGAGKMPFHLHLSRLTFNDGTVVEVPRRGVVALVGPNNVGKTATLREVQRTLERGGPGTVLSNIEFSLSDDLGDLHDWLRGNCATTQEYGLPHYQRANKKIQVSDLNTQRFENKLKDPSRGIGAVASLLTTMLNVERRLAAARSVQAHDPRNDAPENPIQELLEYEALESALRREAKRNFGSEFIIDRSVGKTIHVYWGDEPPVATNADRVSREYLENLRRLPLLDGQGDGVRSFLGTLIHLELSRDFILLIDEPEAFLHPPQAYRLGTLIGQHAKNRQILVATHNSDFLRGLLNGNPEELTFVHLRRQGKVNRTTILQQAALAETLTEPMLRYSNILDGLFHDLIVLCEGEVDCRFYHAAVDHYYKSRDDNDSAKPSIMFADVGGKTGFPRAVAALVAFGIPVRVIGDFDILNSESILSKVVESLGGEWTELVADFKLVAAAVEKMGSPPPKHGELLKLIEPLLKPNPTQRLEQQLARRLEDLVKYPSSWATAKRVGLACLPSGDEHQALKRLVSRLHSLGVCVVPVGEVECWVRDVGGKSMGWLANVFAMASSGTDPYGHELIAFIKSAFDLPHATSSIPQSNSAPILKPLSPARDLSEPSQLPARPESPTSILQFATRPNVSSAISFITIAVATVAMFLSLIAIFAK